MSSKPKTRFKAQDQLDELARECDSIEVITEEGHDFEPVAPGEKVLVILTDNFKRLFSVVNRRHAALKTECEALHGMKETDFKDSTIGGLLDKVKKHADDHTALSALAKQVWALARQEYPELKDVSNIGIRQGWKIVECEVDPLDVLGGLSALSALLGGLDGGMGGRVRAFRL